MKLSIWDILTGVVLLGILCLLVGFGYLLLNPLSNSPMAVEQVATAIVLPTATITNTPLPRTATPVIPTATATRRPTWTPVPTQTPVVLPSFTKAARSSGGSGSGGSCTIITQTPEDGSYELANMDFTVQWSIKNTSAKTWGASSVDIRFVNGDQVHKTANLLDMPYDVSPNGQLDLSVTMHAPADKGDYASYWGLYEGDTALCRFYVKFRVP